MHGRLGRDEKSARPLLIPPHLEVRKPDLVPVEDDAGPVLLVGPVIQRKLRRHLGRLARILEIQPGAALQQAET